MINQEQSELIPLSPGELLRHEREKKSLTIEQIASRVRVRPAIIHAIETGDTDEIPSVYLKGYIRTYARQVGLAPGEIEKHIQHARGNEPAVQSIFKSGLPKNPGDRWLKASSYVLASAVVIALVWQFTNEAVRFSQGGGLIRTSASNPSADEAAKTGTMVNQDSVTDPASDRKPANTHLRASIASLEVDRQQSEGTTPKIAESAWNAVTDYAPLPAGSSPADGNKLTVELSTSADSWVEITDASGNQVEMDLLRAGSQRDYSGEGPFRLLIGRASSVQLNVNGQPVNLAPYTRGNVARVTLGEPESAPVTDPAADQSAVSIEPGADPEVAPEAIPVAGNQESG